MISHKLLFVFFLFCKIIIAQIPKNYYKTALNKSDDSLKQALHQIIDNHIEFPYTSKKTDVWDILKETDKDPKNPDNIILIYSGKSINAKQEYNKGNGWTREHIWAKSRGDFGTITGPGTDVHALRPLDTKTNSIRNNRTFQNCTNCKNVYDKWGNLTQSKIDRKNWTFEVRDNVKGDVARMIFYMSVRYEGERYADLELTNLIPQKNNTEPYHGSLETLLEWHKKDPVDDWERNRNNIIYYQYQKNRNPFIDHPELANYIWSDLKNKLWNIQKIDINFCSKTKSVLIKNNTSEPITLYIYNLKGELEFRQKTSTKNSITPLKKWYKKPYILVIETNTNKTYKELLGL